MTGGTT